MGQWLGALAAIPEHSGAVPNTHMNAHNLLSLLLQGI